MSKDKLSDYDGTTAGNNTDIGGISIAEGMLPSAVNNSMRELTRQLGAFANGTEAVAGISLTGDATFGDNDKAIFGAGSDLQIYSDGTTSFISESGSGNLKIQGNTLRLEDSTGTRYAQGAEGAAFTLMYAGSAKLATTSTGIDVTGTVTADGLTVAGGITTTVATVALDVVEESSGADGLIGLSAHGSGRSQIRSTHTLGTSSDLRFLTVDGGSTRERLKLANNGDISFYDSTGVTQGLFWDASEVRLGLGTTSPARNLHLYAENSDASVRFQNTANSKVWEINPSIPGVANSGISIVNVTDNTVPLHIDNSGNVGIGTDSPSTNLEINGGTNNNIVRIVSTDANANIEFADNTTTSGLQIGANGDDMKFGISGAEAMRIDSSGNVLVGKTASGVANTGAELQSSGFTSITRDGGAPLQLNRKTSDGDLFVAKKDGTTVGSIGAKGGDLIIGTGDVGIRFNDAGDALRPTDQSTGSGRDNAIDIGDSGNRFKDLYLSGGVYLGGTAAANKLDSYEEGSWTPTGATNSGTAATFGSAEGSYVKIGNLVTVNGTITDVDTTGTTSTSQFRIAGLPFAPVSKNWTGAASTNSVAFQSSRTMLTCQVNFATDVISFNVTADGNSRTVVDHNDITSGTSDFFFTVQYQTFS